MAELSLTYENYKNGTSGVSKIVGYESGGNRIVRMAFTTPSTGATSLYFDILLTAPAGERQAGINYKLTDKSTGWESAGADSENDGSLELEFNGSNWHGFIKNIPVKLLPNKTYYLWIFPKTTTYGYFAYLEDRNVLSVDGEYNEYSLSLSSTYASLTCSRTSSPLGGSTGALSNGATIYPNDVLNITFTPNTSYEIETSTLNGSTISSGTSYTVNGNVSIIVKAKLSIFTLSLNYDSGVNLTVKRGSTVLADGTVLNNGETLTITFSLKDADNTQFSETTVNGTTVSSGATHKVSGNVVVQVYSQTKQTQCMVYQAKVYNGSSWANLGLVEFYDSKWKTYGYLGNESGVYTNALNRAVDTSGNVIGRTWWQTNKRFNSSSGDSVDNTGTMITGLIPFSMSDKIRIRWSGNSSNTYQQLKFYKADFTQCQQGYLNFYNLNKNNGTTYTVDQYDLTGGKIDFSILSTTSAIHKDAAYFVVVLYESDINNVIITLNEEID